MYFINTNWKHLQLLTVTFITLEVHGTDIGSGTAHRLVCGQDIAADHTAQVSTASASHTRPVPTDPAPRGMDPARPKVSPTLPSWAQDPSLHPSPDTQGAGHRGSL